MVNATVDYNELDFARQQNGEKKQPDYILVFKKNGQISNLDEAKKAQLDWGGKLPIVVVDVDRCLETEKARVEEMKQKYKENPTEELAKQIYQKVRNNRVTYSKFCPEIEDFLNQQPDREKNGTKKLLKNSITSKVKSVYHKVKQKAVNLIGIMTAKDAYENTTVVERTEEMLKFKQILSQLQEISKGEESNER